jgi:hypothetical protein
VYWSALSGRTLHVSSYTNPCLDVHIETFNRPL